MESKSFFFVAQVLVPVNLCFVTWKVEHRKPYPGCASNMGGCLLKAPTHQLASQCLRDGKWNCKITLKNNPGNTNKQQTSNNKKKNKNQEPRTKNHHHHHHNHHQEQEEEAKYLHSTRPSTNKIPPSPWTNHVPPPSFSTSRWIWPLAGEKGLEVWEGCLSSHRQKKGEETNTVQQKCGTLQCCLKLTMFQNLLK